MTEPAASKKAHAVPPPPFVPCPPEGDGAKARKPVKPGSAGGDVKWCPAAPAEPADESKAKAAPPPDADKNKDQPEGQPKPVPAADLQPPPVVAPHGQITNAWKVTNHAAPESDLPPKGSTPAGVYNRTEGQFRVDMRAGPVVFSPYAEYDTSIDPTKGAPAAESVEKAGVGVQFGPVRVAAEGAVRHNNGFTPAAPVNFANGDFSLGYNPTGRFGPYTTLGMESLTYLRVSDEKHEKVFGQAAFVATETHGAPGTPGQVVVTEKAGIGGADYIKSGRHDFYATPLTLDVSARVAKHVEMGGDVTVSYTKSSDAAHDGVAVVRTSPVKIKVAF